MITANEHKQVPFRTVLMDSWYATRHLMLHIERVGKLFIVRSKTIGKSTKAMTFTSATGEWAR
jgi:hypothetical protein